MRWKRKILAVSLLLGSFGPVEAEIEPPNYAWCLLDSVYPSGGQRGQSVRVLFRVREKGAKGARAILVEGGPGIVVRDLEAGDEVVKATFEIAADAPLGRRRVRVHGGRGGLTNFRWFEVGDEAEYIEDEKAGNNTPGKANRVNTPVVVNGRIQEPVDQDCFRFPAKQGELIVAAINSHGLDAMGFDRDTRGFVDLNLELLDGKGRILSSAGDTLGFDPALELTIPADGEYTVRVSGLGFAGFPQAVYRLTLGNIGYATSAFPGGGSQAESVSVELDGLNMPTTSLLVRPSADRHPVRYLVPENVVAHDLAFVTGVGPEEREWEPNNVAEEARTLTLGTIVNGRFLEEGDEDWFRISLEKRQKIELEIMAQRHLRSPVDTLLEVFDSEGKRVAGNDDGLIFGGETTHDFTAFDSYLLFASKKDGDYQIRLSEQTGASGPRTVYRLSAREARPDFRLYQWPDVVPVWGPGSTASFPVEIIRTGGFTGDVELSVEGLPGGWSGNIGFTNGAEYRNPPTKALGTKALLTISAPSDSQPGDLAEFHVVGRSQTDGQTMERSAQSLTLFAYGDPHRFRISPISRAVVAPAAGPWLSTELTHLRGKPGDELTIPVLIQGSSNEGKEESVQIIVNRASAHFKTAFGAPVTVEAGQKAFAMPLTIPATFKPGIYGIVVARQWRSDLRIGLPGPCTPLIRLEVGEPSQ